MVAGRNVTAAEMAYTMTKTQLEEAQKKKGRRLQQCRQQQTERHLDNQAISTAMLAQQVAQNRMRENEAKRHGSNQIMLIDNEPMATYQPMATVWTIPTTTHQHTQCPLHTT